MSAPLPGSLGILYFSCCHSSRVLCSCVILPRKAKSLNRILCAKVTFVKVSSWLGILEGFPLALIMLSLPVLQNLWSIYQNSSQIYLFQSSYMFPHISFPLSNFFQYRRYVLQTMRCAWLVLSPLLLPFFYFLCPSSSLCSSLHFLSLQYSLSLLAIEAGILLVLWKGSVWLNFCS